MKEGRGKGWWGGEGGERRGTVGQCLLELARRGCYDNLPAVVDLLVDAGHALVWQIEIHILHEALDGQLVPVQKHLHSGSAKSARCALPLKDSAFAAGLRALLHPGTGSFSIF